MYANRQEETQQIYYEHLQLRAIPCYSMPQERRNTRKALSSYFGFLT